MARRGRASVPLRPHFDRRLRLRFHGAKVTSDAGLLAYRELDDAFDLGHLADARELQDTRTGQNTQLTARAISPIDGPNAGHYRRNQNANRS